ncbi:MAG: type II toxin-antitoxin system RelE/ParE family toxin, partial [Actinomycetota bacterium]|nr:type II toxin-antitoxin system RelE/ParE family toxin [Actinomycetota bacterium]
MRFAWTEHVYAQPDEAMAFIARDRPEAATAWLECLLDAGASLAELPDRGRVVPEAARGDVRELIISPYRLICRRDANMVTITMVAHGRRERVPGRRRLTGGRAPGAIMPEVIYYVASSLDGYIATPDGGLGWLAAFEASGEDYGYDVFYESIDVVLLGSRTFEQALTFGDWPYAGKSAWVFTSRRLETARDDVTVTDRSPSDVVAQLETQGVRRAWLVGGGSLAGSF